MVRPISAGRAAVGRGVEASSETEISWNMARNWTRLLNRDTSALFRLAVADTSKALKHRFHRFHRLRHGSD